MNQEPVNPSPAASESGQPYQPAPAQPTQPYQPYQPYEPYNPYQPAPSHLEPPQVADTEEPKQNAGCRQIGCNILLAVMILGCVALSVGGILAARAFTDSTNQSNAAQSVVSSFCGAESAQNFAQAYSYFSPSFKQQMTLDEFIQKSLSATQTHGAVARCEIDPNGNISLAGATGSIDIAVSHADADTVSGTVYVVEAANNQWYIDNVARSLGFF